MGIKGKVVIITGSGSGIGRATALLLASKGARVVLGARREEQIAGVAKQIEAAGGEAIFRATDVSRRDEFEALVKLACEHFGRLDVLVNNAAVAPMSPFDALCVADWDAMVDINVKGMLYGIAAALPVFTRQESGHIINVLSTAGLKIVPGMGVYAATKNAGRTITEALRLESGPNLRVTEVTPGFTATDMSSGIRDKAMREATQKRSAEVAISPDALASAIAYAIDQPPEVEVGSIVVRPTAQV